MILVNSVLWYFIFQISQFIFHNSALSQASAKWHTSQAGAAILGMCQVLSGECRVANDECRVGHWKNDYQYSELVCSTFPSEAKKSLQLATRHSALATRNSSLKEGCQPPAQMRKRQGQPGGVAGMNTGTAIGASGRLPVPRLAAGGAAGLG